MQVPFTTATAGHSVAIVGAGAGGASTAYWLSQLNPTSNLKLTVYESSNYIGGRSTTVDILGLPIELGASLFVDVNKNMMGATEAFGLNFTDPPDLSLGIWNGKKFIYRTGKGGLWDSIKLFWKYGTSPIRANNLVKAIVTKFMVIYDLMPFKDLSHVASELELLKYVNQTGLKTFKDGKTSELFIHDILNAATRVNYGQGIDRLHGLMSAVSFATDGAHAIEGGNWQVFAGMLGQSGAEVRLSTTVTALNATDGGWSVCVPRGCEWFNQVVIAHPLTYTTMEITPAINYYKSAYVDLHVTIVATKAKLSEMYFGPDPPEEVITTTSFFISKFTSISQVGKVNGTFIYKLFSASKLDAVYLYTLFEAGAIFETIYRKEWKAYPIGSPTAVFDEWEKAPGLWYLNGMERFISTMETMTIAGRNVASLMSATIK